MKLIQLVKLSMMLVLLSLATTSNAQPDSTEFPLSTYQEMLRVNLDEGTFKVYRWLDFPEIYIIHFENYLLQGKTVNRIATYLEKAGMRGKVMSWPKLKRYLRLNYYSMENLYSAHDYRTSDLAIFFNVMAGANERLSEQEQTFLDLLVALNLLSWDEGSRMWAATGNQAVLSIASYYLGSELPSSRVLGQPRREFEAHSLYHEMRHGLYFTEPKYAQACRDYWNDVLGYNDRRAIRLSLWAGDYDHADEELMINEWQAYLLTPAFEFIGVNALTLALREMADGRRIPKKMGNSDKTFLRKNAYQMADDLERWMVDDLRNWLGAKWDTPTIKEVTSFRMY